MPSDVIPGVLATIRVLDKDDVTGFAYRLISDERLPSHDFLSSLSADDCNIIARVLLYAVTRGNTIIPRDFQLQASLETVHGRDSVIIAGTGHGKTLSIVIPLLLFSGSMTITISLPKCLQMMQVHVVYYFAGYILFIYCCRSKNLSLSEFLPRNQHNTFRSHMEGTSVILVFPIS
ncbi:hypothetical protein L208DRAFT_1372830 [Tricholoma matsutake]|nr:hypothetical protein L208DRAFT_1372830 [Tricholoma matsutake 945]